jgi:hypothetical protein
MDWIEEAPAPGVQLLAPSFLVMLLVEMETPTGYWNVTLQATIGEAPAPSVGVKRGEGVGEPIQPVL